MVFKPKYLLQMLTAVFLTFIITSCGFGSAPKGRKPSPDWSRGVPIGTTVAGTVGMAVEGDSEQFHFVWPKFVEGELAIHYLQLDETAVPLIDKTLELPAGRSRTPRFWLADEGLYLVWARRPSGGNWELWQALLDDNGDIIKPTQLSMAEMNVSSYVLTDEYIVWEDSKTNSIYGWHNNESTTPIQLVAEGENPSIQKSSDGKLHMSWRNGLNIYYAAFAHGLETADGTPIVELELQPTDSLGGPVLGITDEYGYLIWSRYISAGLESDTGRTDYAIFSLDNPRKVPAKRLVIMPAEEQPYQPYNGDYALSQIVPAPTSAIMGNNYTIEPNAAGTQGASLAVVVASQQQIRLNDFTQMAVTIFSDGQFQGYQMAAKTEGFSQEGMLVTDVNGNLHLVWREGGSGRALYFATTNPALATHLDSLDSDDFIEATLTGALEGVVGIAFFPLALLWFLPGGIILGVRQLRRDDDDPRQLGARVLIVISILLYEYTKLLVLPTVLSYVPFSAWLEIPQSWWLPLRISYPVITLALGFVAAQWVLRRRAHTSPLSYFFILAATDAVLTLGVYGVAFLGRL